MTDELKMLKQIKGSRRWPYQFVTPKGSRLRIGGKNAWQEANRLLKGLECDIKIKRYKP